MKRNNNLTVWVFFKDLNYLHLHIHCAMFQHSVESTSFKLIIEKNRNNLSQFAVWMYIFTWFKTDFHYALPTENILHSFSYDTGILVRRIDNTRNIVFIMSSLKWLCQGSYGSIMGRQAWVQAHHGCILIAGVVKDLRCVCSCVCGGFETWANSYHEATTENSSRPTKGFLRLHFCLETDIHPVTIWRNMML